MNFLWDLLGEPMKNYRTKHTKGNPSSRTIRTFEIILAIQNRNSNLCGMYCLFMAHYLNDIHFTENVSAFFCKGWKSFTSKMQDSTSRSLSKLKLFQKLKLYVISVNVISDIKFVRLGVIPKKLFLVSFNCQCECYQYRKQVYIFFVFGGR